MQNERWGGPIVDLYNVNGVPNSFLIGPDGEIIARLLRGEALKEKIAELMTN